MPLLIPIYNGARWDKNAKTTRKKELRRERPKKMVYKKIII
jgi:hypothetical protein